MCATIRVAERRQRRRISAEVHLIRPEQVGDDGQASLADRDQLERVFRYLKPDQRTAIVLHGYLGFPAREAADVLGAAGGSFATDTEPAHFGHPLGLSEIGLD